MKALIKKSKLALLSCILPLGLTGAIAFSFTKAADANPLGMKGSYTSASISSQLTHGGYSNSNAQVAGDIQRRVTISHTSLDARNSVVQDTAADITISKDVFAFGDGNFSSDADQNGDANPVDFQVGVGYRL